MVTIKDIAREAGVSQGTVSNVLNGRGNVSSEKIRLVEDACRSLGYVPNERAKVLRRGSGRVLGVVVPALEEKRHTDFFAGFRAYAESHGYGARLYILRSDDREAEEAALRDAQSDMVSGVALFSRCRGASFPTGEGSPAVLHVEHAAEGCRSFIVGIGGSATNDGGIGMLQSLGFGLLDEEGQQVPFGAQGLEKLARITKDNVVPELSECTFRIACDVTNPLCGDKGCSAIYGPQKGATPSMILQMDKWLASYAALAKTVFEDADPDYPGSGAAGGIGFAFRTFTNASLTSGIDIVLEETRLESYIRDADIVVTGEGRLDGQTVMGKAPIGVAKIAKKYGKQVVAFAGCVTEDAIACNEHGIDAFFPILRGVVTLEEAMDSDNARRNMAATVEQVFRLIPDQY